MQGVGAFVMGRKMFGGGDGPWDESWKGWWGEEPPFHAPVFALTHHPREPLGMQGARPSTSSPTASSRLDELYLHIAPVVLGEGERLLANVGDPTLEPVKVVASPAVTHVNYRVVR